MWGKNVNGKCVYKKRNNFFFLWKIAVQTISRICVLNHRHCFGLIGWLCFSFDKLYIWLEMMISIMVFKLKGVPGKMPWEIQARIQVETNMWEGAHGHGRTNFGLEQRQELPHTSKLLHPCSIANGWLPNFNHRSCLPLGWKTQLW